MNQKNWNNLHLEQMINYLENVEGKVVLGIDGIIDEVWQVLETRVSKNEFKTIDKMKKFGEIIVNRAEGGMANELIKKRRICGGFTANTGRAVGNLKLSTTMLGMYGKDAIDPIYDEFKDKCTLISLGNPALCNVLEFPDGKIMLPYIKELLDFEWMDLINILGHEKLKSIFGNADIVSLGYWSNMPAFNELITNIHENYFTENHPKRLFFDFANIKKRSVEALKETIDVLGALNNKIPVTLSLNEHEAVLLFSYFGEELADDIAEVAKTAATLRSKINFDEIIIHTPYYSMAVSQSENIGVAVQDYSSNPVRTAGAGDTFNGAYIAACLKDLKINERLAIANATTSFYVNNGFPPNRENLIKEIKRIREKLS
jgi:sugar/nucleoside kinase (ribokinase family)